ncbi:TPA: restriction endonuclease subunit S [Vibrio parahaemolyticus]|uniref:restriction endonuclease subunit S n=1 Tax=Vibrio TaxID=662 RepID=UPI001EEC49C7|nr:MULTISPECIES: restriction endonuclease subunit S [Vibrio]MCG6286297.1 restriction endonuclease subunit S [Vibrio vulnificus]MDE0550858.1 restriction endonuclease subunit S [Vibrio sp. VP6]
MSESHLTLNDVCEFIVDCLHKTAPTQSTGFPLIRTPNVGRGRLLLDGVYRVSQENYDIWTQRAIPEPEDLILAREAPAGNVAIVPHGENVVLGQRTVHLRPNKEIIDPKFLCYFLLAPVQQANLLAGETGATAKHVNMKDIRRLPLPGLPALVVQRKLGNIIATYDDLIENNRRRIQLLEESARLLYQEWFVHLRFPGHEQAKIIDGVPEGWEKKTLKQIATLNYGKALKADVRIPGPYPVYGSSGEVGSHEKALVDGPGIVIGRKGNVGSVFWVNTDFFPIDTVYFITQEQSSLFLYHALKNVQFINTDVAVPGLNRDMAYSREILVPDEINYGNFIREVQPIQHQINKLKDYSDKLAQARDLLLPKLMSGELAV